MPLIANIVITALLAAGIGADTPPTSAPIHTGQQCAMTLGYGHVPGHLDPVWTLVCGATNDVGADGTPSPDDEPSTTQPVAPNERIDGD